jgi:hypothetical protein
MPTEGVFDSSNPPQECPKCGGPAKLVGAETDGSAVSRRYRCEQTKCRSLTIR